MSAFEKGVLSIIFLFCVGAFLDQTTEIGTRFWQDMNDSHYMYAVYEDGQYGYINARGRIEIKPQYIQVDPVFEGELTPAKHIDQGSWGYIDRIGNWAIWPRYSWARDFKGDLAAIGVETPLSYSYGFVNRKGMIAIEPRFNSVRDFHEGLAGVKLGAHWGFINDTGMFIVRPDYDDVKDFAQERVAVQRDGKWAVITNLSEQKTDFVYDDIGHYSEGLAPVRQGGYWGYINLEGDVTIPLKYTAAEMFTEGLGLVRTAVGWRFIDPQGNTVIDLPNVVDARPFSDGLAAIKKLPPDASDVTPAKWGYINTEGTMVIPPEYEVAMDFQKGVASVGLDRNASYRGYINKNNEFIWKPLNLMSFGKDKPNYGMYFLIGGLILYGLGLMRVFMRPSEEEPRKDEQEYVSLRATYVDQHSNEEITEEVRVPTKPQSYTTEPTAESKLESTATNKPVEPPPTPMPQGKIVKSYEQVDEPEPIQLAGKFDEYQAELDRAHAQAKQQDVKKPAKDDQDPSGFFKPIQLAKTPKHKKQDKAKEKSGGWFSKPIQIARTPKKKKNT